MDRGRWFELGGLVRRHRRGQAAIQVDAEIRQPRVIERCDEPGEVVLSEAGHGSRFRRLLIVRTEPATG